MKQKQLSQNTRQKNPAKTALIVLFWLVAWEIADRVINNRIILSGPIHIVQALIAQMGQADFWIICGASFLRIAVGFILSFAAGFLLALVCHRFQIIRDFLEPNQALTIYLSFLIVLPIIYTNTLQGLETVSPEMLEMAKIFHLAPWKKFLYVYRPAFMPFVRSGCKLALGMSWKSGIMAEVIGTPKPSIGREMYAAKSYLQTADLFAWTVVVVILSVVFEKVFMLLLTWLGRPGGTLLTGKKTEDE